jgi:hypothetical protein
MQKTATKRQFLFTSRQGVIVQKILLLVSSPEFKKTKSERKLTDVLNKSTSMPVPGKPATSYMSLYSDNLGILQSNNLFNQTVYKNRTKFLAVLAALV